LQPHKPEAQNMGRIHWLRILLFGFLSELAIFAVFIPATTLLGEVPGMYTAVGASLVMPFLFGILAVRKVKSHPYIHGVLVGAVGIVIYVGLSGGQPEPALYIVAHGLKLLGGAAGGAFVQRSRERDVLTAGGQTV
jgi:hypothetical protein